MDTNLSEFSKLNYPQTEADRSNLLYNKNYS